MRQGTILGSHVGKWLVLAALVVVLGAVLTLSNTAPGLVFGQAASPAAPTGVRAVAVSGNTIEVYWTAPGNDGGSPITGYQVEWSTDGGTNWPADTNTPVTTGATTTHVSVTGAAGGATRHYRVRAVNRVGNGAASHPPIAVSTPPADGYPAAPENLMAMANGPSEINLTWTALTGAANTGGVPIKGYMIEYTEKADSTTPANPALPWKVLIANTNSTKGEYSDTGLKPATMRWYRVSGINEDDERGSASSTANAVVDDISATTTPNGVPAAPTGVKAVAVNGTDVEIYWTAPTNYGGAPVTDYIVEWSANGTSGWAAITGRTASKATHQVQTGLTAGDTRHYRVRAVNAVSDAGGVASDPPVKVTTPDGTRPVAPTLTAQPGSSTSIALSWTRPAGTITGYVVEYTEKENTAGDAAALPWKELTRTSSLTANHPGLKPETKRWYRVAAINSKGRGVASDPVSETTDELSTATMPGRPTGVRAVAVSGNTIEVYWTAPGNDGGSPITGYQVEWSTDGGTNWPADTNTPVTTGATTTHVSVTGAAGGATRHYRVRAVNRVGNGTESHPPVAVSTPPATGYPAAPENLMAMANGPSEINLTWTALTGAANTGGVPIKGYMIEYTEKADSTTPANPALPWKVLIANTNSTKGEYSDTGLKTGHHAVVPGVGNQRG